MDGVVRIAEAGTSCAKESTLCESSDRVMGAIAALMLTSGIGLTLSRARSTATIATSPLTGRPPTSVRRTVSEVLVPGSTTGDATCMATLTGSGGGSTSTVSE